MLSVVTLLLVNMGFILAYWIPKRFFIQCDFDKADVFNIYLTKPTCTVCWFQFLHFNFKNLQR